jgi:hypothetical protein
LTQNRGRVALHEVNPYADAEANNWAGGKRKSGKKLLFLLRLLLIRTFGFLQAGSFRGSGKFGLSSSPNMPFDWQPPNISPVLNSQKGLDFTRSGWSTFVDHVLEIDFTLSPFLI